jgi:hypothetical protein
MPDPVDDDARPAGLDYARRVYDRVIDWYKVAESKAQLLLTVNGAFAAVFFGFASGGLAGSRHIGRSSGVATWFLLATAILAFGGAVGFGAAGLLSRHRKNIRDDFVRLEIRPDDPETYQADAAWYYGHLASLDFDHAVAFLRKADQRMEFEALTYNVVGLSHVVLRKHRLVNAGWQLTALAVLTMIATSLSILV